MRRCGYRVLLVAAGLALACKVAPTTVLLQIRAEPGVGELDELRLSVLAGSEVPVKDRRLPPEGRPTLPGEVVLYPPGDAGTVRILVRGLRGSAVTAEGATVVQLIRETQVTATVNLSLGTLPDRDGDGVPDAIDNCPELPNPAQGPCAADARVEARPDAGDGPPAGDSRSDLRGDLGCDRDKDQHLSIACGGSDCDDDRAAVHPGASEGPPGDPSCSDGLDNDCDGSKDSADTECKSCLADGDCDDKNPCTSDACVTGSCSNPPANEGGACDDKNACTVQTVCGSGVCGGGQPLVCSPPAACKTVSCDPSSGCVTSNQVNGSTCSDGLFCTNPDTCTGGVCGGPARDCSVGLLACHARSCNEATDQCVDSTLANGTGCDDKDLCTQGEQCQGGSCTPPPLKNEVIFSGGAIANLGQRTTAIDGSGAVHTVFHDGTKLLYATNKSGSWANETIATGTGDHWPSLFLDGQGIPQVAFVDPATSELKHSKRGAATWSTAMVAATAKGPTSITVGANGAVHLLFTRGTNQELHHAVGPAPWQTSLAGTAAASANVLASSIVLDAQGKVHIAATWTPSFRLQYLTNATGTWAGSDPAAGTLTGSYGLWPSIAIGATGNLHIAHQASDTTKAIVYYTTRIAGTWQTITAETSATGSGTAGGRHTSLVLDSQEKVQIAYRNSVLDLLRHLSNRSGAWVGQDLDTSGNTGRWPSIARAPSGRIHLTYERDTAKELRHLSFSACP